MRIYGLFDPKRKKEVEDGLKKGEIPPRARPRIPQPAPSVPARTEEEQKELNAKLLDAAEKGDMEAVKDVLAKGADIDAPDITMWWTALMWASSEGHTDIVKLMIDKGAMINATDPVDGWTALILASKNGHVEIVRLLLEGGIDIDVKNKFGVSALAWAALEGHTEIVEMLRRHGAKG